VRARTLVGMLVAAAVLATIPALAQAGVASRGPAPDGASRLGPLCRHDTQHFRAWWSDRPGAPGALPGADGSCASLPPLVTEVLDAANAARDRAVRMGFPATIGDAPPTVLRDARFTRQLLRYPPPLRAAALGSLSPVVRGRLLAGMTAAPRNGVLRGLAPGLRRRMTGELRTAQRGRPADLVGGDRRVDLVLDGSARGVSGFVRPGQPGSAVCRTSTRGSQRVFVATWLTVLVTADVAAARATTAHELMHVVQCVMGVHPGTPLLVKEGTAEWFAALAEPASFPGTVPAGGVAGGNARAVSFCNSFDPRGGGLQPYASWAVWDVLGTRSVRSVLSGYRRSAAGGDGGAIGRVGAARWSEAVRVAAREVCGNRRSPSGAVAFAPEVRDFLGATSSPARAGAPATVTVPAGGVATAAAIWGALPAAAVTVRLSAPGVAPEALAAHVVASTSAGALTPGVREGAAVVEIPAAALGERYVPVTVANPSAGAPTPVSIEVHITPAA
jgi:hypothetical protein